MACQCRPKATWLAWGGPLYIGETTVEGRLRQSGDRRARPWRLSWTGANNSLNREPPGASFPNGDTVELDEALAHLTRLLNESPLIRRKGANTKTLELSH